MKKYGRYKEMDALEKYELQKNSKGPATLSIALKIRDFISDKEMNDKDFSDLTGIPTSTLWGYINAESEMKAETIVKIADVMGVSVDYLLGRTDIRTSDVDDISICKKTGLSERSLNNLKAINGGSHTWLLDTINFLLENELHFEDEDLYVQELTELQDFPETVYEGITEECINEKIANITKKLESFDAIRKKLSPLYVISKIDEFLTTRAVNQNVVLEGSKETNSLTSGSNIIFTTNFSRKIDINDKVIDDVLIKEVNFALQNAKIKFSNKEGE